VIPEDVQRFIMTSIASVPHLEALLLIRAEREKEWDAARIAHRLYIAEKSAADILVDLAAAAFLAVEGDPVGASYRPEAAGQAEMVDRVAAAYARDLVEVTNLIHRKAARAFADAFRIRKD
jgi:hypothetical protein